MPQIIFVLNVDLFYSMGLRIGHSLHEVPVIVGF